MNIKKMQYTYTMKHYSATKKKEILAFATTQKDLEGTTLSELSHTMTNTTWSHLNVELKNKTRFRHKEQFGGCQRQGFGVGKMGEIGQKTQNSSYK